MHCKILPSATADWLSVQHRRCIAVDAIVGEIPPSAFHNVVGAPNKCTLMPATHLRTATENGGEKLYRFGAHVFDKRPSQIFTRLSAACRMLSTWTWTFVVFFCCCFFLLVCILNILTARFVRQAARDSASGFCNTRVVREVRELIVLFCGRWL